MYHFVVKRIVRRSFQDLSRGNHGTATNLMAERCHYHFIGQQRLVVTGTVGRSSQVV